MENNNEMAIGANLNKDANKAMKENQQTGELKDKYTGKTIKQNESANLDHTISRKEIFENQREKNEIANSDHTVARKEIFENQHRKQANLSTEKLANKD